MFPFASEGIENMGKVAADLLVFWIVCILYTGGGDFEVF